MNVSATRTERRCGSRPRWSLNWRSAVLAVTCAFFTSAVFAVEQAEEFLQGLKDRGLHELAIDYLERMETSKLAGEDFKRKIPYHRGVVLMELSRQSADPATRNRRLEDARAELERFAESQPEDVQAAEAHLQLATVQMTRGQQLVTQAAQLPAEPAYDEQRQTLAGEARAHFETAREVFDRARAIYSSELAKLPPTTSAESKGETGNLRQEYRARVAQLRFLAAQSQFEAAQTYPPDVREFGPQHAAAAKAMSAVYDEFGRAFLVGLYARLYEGRCYQATGQYALALGCFDEILNQPNVLPPFRKLIASAVHRKAEVLIAQEKYDAAIESCRACLRDASSDEQQEPEWLAVRFRLAEALQTKAESRTSGAAEQRRLLAEAREAYRLVANSPGEFQSAARAAAATLARGDAAATNQPRSFKAAYDAGKDALASYNAAKLALPAAERNHPEAIPDLEAQMEQGKQDARHNFRAATTLVDDDTDIKLLNEVRYFLCWLDWENEDFYRAAILGEFLARRYPDHPAAASAAKIAMASWERLYSQAAAAGGGGAADTDFEAGRMARMAEFVARRWPGTPDADAAQSVLVSYAIRSNRIEDAEKLLASTSRDSRPQLEMQLGNAIWGRFLELSQPGRNPAADEAELAQLKASALKYLRSGLEAARDERQASDVAATAGLYLVQALLSDDKHEEAVALLEDRQVGPLTLVERNHPAATRPHYAIEAYKAALRAYVLATPPQEQKALDVMQSLEKLVGKDGADATVSGAEQLTQIYLSLGLSLQKQMEQLHEEGRGREAERIAAAFAQFLDRIAARQKGADWPIRAWVAGTYYNLAAAERDESAARPAKLSDAARGYLTKSRDAYRQLLDDASKDTNLAPSETALLAAKMQLGECYRALGQYQQALDTFSDILKDRESSLAVQRAAAYTYQERGQAEDPQWFDRAIHGGYTLRSTGQNRIWGWLKISQVAARAARADEKHLDTFYEARMNVARCRYLAAMKRSGAQRQQDLARAKQSIQSLAQLYPDLGGQRWRGEFDALLKQIQSAAGEQPAGLREFSAGQSPQANPSERRG